MRKKIIILFIFSSFFFTKPAPIYAANPFEFLWTWITNGLNRLLGSNISHITYNQDPSVLNQTNTLTDYTAINQDESNRIIPEATKKYQKGVWFYEVLNTKKYTETKNKKSQITENCPYAITINDLVCFYYQNEEKILYQRGNQKPLENPEGTNCGKLDNPDNCYRNFYINYQNIPRGFFQGEDDIAPTVSTQLNDTMRTIIPNKDLGQTAPDNDDTSEKAQAIAQDTDSKEIFKLIGLIPQNYHSKIPCVSNDTEFSSSGINENNKDKNRKYLRQTFKQWLIPKSWQTDENQFNVVDLTKITPPYCPPKEGSTAGYSEIGALGMAMSGIKYQEILDRYFDTIEDDLYSVKKIPDFSTKNFIVKVELVEKWKREDNIDTPENSKNKYQECIDLANDNNLEGEIGYEIINIAKTKTYQREGVKVGYEGEIPNPNYDCKHNNPQEYNQWSEERKKIWNETEHDLWNKNCTYIMTMSVDDYLMGIAEILNGWHVEAWKSLIVACRNNLFRENIEGTTITTPNCIQQAFRCRSLHTNKTSLKNNIYTNSATAVSSTENQFLVDKNNNIIHGNIFAKLCQKQKYFPFYDGTFYEGIGLIVKEAPLSNYSGVCYQDLNPNDPVSSLGADDGDF